MSSVFISANRVSYDAHRDSYSDMITGTEHSAAFICPGCEIRMTQERWWWCWWWCNRRVTQCTRSRSRWMSWLFSLKSQKTLLDRGGGVEIKETRAGWKPEGSFLRPFDLRLSINRDFPPYFLRLRVYRNRKRLWMRCVCVTATKEVKGEESRFWVHIFGLEVSVQVGVARWCSELPGVKRRGCLDVG